MAKQRKPFLVRHTQFNVQYDSIWNHNLDGTHQEYRGAFRGDYSRTTNFPPPNLGDINTVISKIDELIKNNKNDELGKFLQANFIIEITGEEYYKGDVLDMPSGTIGDSYTYQDYLFRSNLESLLLSAPHEFNTFLIATKDNLETHTILLQSFQHIHLENNESIHFTEFDLTNASFKGSVLAKSNFENSITKEADFSDSDIRSCNISQQQLDECATYDKAELPYCYWGYWNDDIKKTLQAKLDKLQTYVKNKLDENDPKYIKATELYNLYTPLLKQDKITAAEKQKMIVDLSSDDTLHTFKENRNLRFIIGEMISFILLAGIGYIIAASIMKFYVTGHFGLFAQPETENITKGLITEIATTRHANLNF